MARSHAGRDDIHGPQWPEPWTKMVQPLACQIGRPGNKPDRPGERIRILPVEGRPTRGRLNLTADVAGDRPLCLNTSELLPIFHRARQATAPPPKYHPTSGTPPRHPSASQNVALSPSGRLGTPASRRNERPREPCCCAGFAGRKGGRRMGEGEGTSLR